MLQRKLGFFFFVLAGLAVLAAFLICGENSALAREGEPEGNPVTAPASGSTAGGPFDNLAVILVIDISGSMSYTDPLRLRETAAGMFIDLLGADDYLGVIIFDDKAELVAPLSPVGSIPDRELLTEKLFPQLDPRGDTDYTEALRLAHRQFTDTDTGERATVILLLTDGEPDPYPGSLDDADFMAEYMESLWEQVEMLAREGILVYTVGFSDEIDPEVIRRIATASRGQYYILQEPAELLLAFYRALGALKDRRDFLEEKIDLGSGGTHTLSFDVREYTRQLNLVLVSSAAPDEADLNLTVKPPRGSAENIDELSSGGRDNYQTVIISRPREDHFGSWEVEISGSGEVLAIGNADLYLEALLVDPDPGAHYPLYEPMEIRVEVVTRERYGGEVFQLEMKVTGPGDPSPIGVAMVRDGNSYLGTYDYVDRPGDYRLDWQILRGGEPFLSNSALISVRRLPAITTDFWVDSEGFRLGEELVVSASLTSGGERLQQGLHLQVDSIDLNLEYRDGARVESKLFDSGDRAHGNSRAGDGVWSNRLLFDREGAARVLLTATGNYRGSAFVLKKSFGITVAASGSLSLRILPEELWAQPGEIMVLPLEITSESPFTQTLRIATDSGTVRLLQDRVTVPPGAVTLLSLEMEIADTMPAGQHFITLGFAADDGMVVLQPEELDFEVDILTRGEAFLKKYSGLGLKVGLAAAALLLAAGILFGGGILLYRYYLLPRLKLGGQLVYRAAAAGSEKSDRGEDTIDLGQFSKRVAIISFGQGSSLQPDYTITGKTSGYDMVISNHWNERLPRFWRGWRALMRRQLTVETVLRCTPPGVLLVDGKIYTRKELLANDQFESGGFIFQYRSSPVKGSRVKNRGVNILDGKL